MMKTIGVYKIFFVSIGIIIFVGWLFFSQKTIHLNTCSSTDIDQQYLCYEKNAHKLAVEKDIPASLSYVKTTVVPNGYGMTHFVLHTIGEDAYYQTRDIDKSLMYNSSYIVNDPHKDGFDGFLHGVFRAFFKKEKNNKSIKELIKISCGKYFAPNDPYKDNEKKTGSVADECFHGIGHALMSVNRNDVLISIKDCEKSPYTWMHYACYRGVFMENAYLFLPFYETQSPKPYAKGKSMVDICNKLEKETAEYCAPYAGESYILSNKTDFSGAFDVCMQLTYIETRSKCISRIASFYIPMVYKHDKEKMLAICKGVKSPYDKICIEGVKTGIELGVAGQHTLH